MQSSIWAAATVPAGRRKPVFLRWKGEFKRIQSEMQREETVLQANGKA